MGKLLERKKRWTNKGTDTPCVADSLIQYNLSYLMFVPNFKILGQVVAEKPLTKISYSLPWMDRQKEE